MPRLSKVETAIMVMIYMMILNKDTTSIRYQPYTTSNNAIPDYSFRNCQWLKSLAIPNSVYSIGAFAFSNCTSLFSMNIPQGISEIGYSAFSNCSALTEINVADENADYCSLDGVLFDKERKTLIQYPIGNSRTSYSVNDSIHTLGLSSFSNCQNLTSIIFGNGLQQIRSASFKGCFHLSEIYSKADNPPTLEVFNNIGAFDGVRISLVQLHVPYGKKSEYQLVGGWRNFKNIID